MKSKPSLHQLNKIKDAYISRTDEIDMFRQQVISFFQTSKQFKSSPLPLIHSIKSRLKDPDHLIDKVATQIGGDVGDTMMLHDEICHLYPVFAFTEIDIH